MTRPCTTAALFAALLALGSGCDVNPFDPAQVPVVVVQAGSPPAFSWTPAGAQIVRVYRGTSAGDGYTPDLVWEVASTDGRNGLQGPVTYGVVPAGGAEGVPPAALEPGQPYTIWVSRYDEAGSGDGFSNTRNRYEGTATFVP